MTDEAYWSHVQALRLRIADMLTSLDTQEWDADSLCIGWRVRDVAGHLSIVTTITTRQMLAVAPRARFNPKRINTAIAVRNGFRPTDEIAEAIRLRAADRTTARVLNTRDSLFDVIVHSQDIAVPLGHPFAVPVDATRRGLDRVWEMGWPFDARKRLAGLTLTATDADWRVGAGPEVAGPALALLLLLTGRTATARHDLVGAGLQRLPA